MDYRFLRDDDLEAMHDTFLKAFADYFVESQLSAEQFTRHIVQNAVRLDLSVGAFAGLTMVGILLNGIDNWNGQLTAYDAGTGVVAEQRGQGLAGAMFNFALPALRAAGVTQCLLEVIQENTAAIKAYERLGFRIVRELDCFHCTEPGFKGGQARVTEVTIEEIDEPNWNHLQTYWDWQPSWQNGIGAARRGGARTRMLGAFLNGACVGYCLFSPASGRLIQLAVTSAHRQRGIGTALLEAAGERAAKGQKLSIINVDASARATLAFLTSRGFVTNVRQYEMMRPL